MKFVWSLAVLALLSVIAYSQWQQMLLAQTVRSYVPSTVTNSSSVSQSTVSASSFDSLRADIPSFGRDVLR